MSDLETEMPVFEGIITKIEQQKRSKQRYNIFIDEKFAFSVHEDVMLKYRLLKGVQVQKDELEEVLAADELNKAYLDAVRLLSSRLRSEYEMRSRLSQKGYDPEIAVQVTERLRKEGYLNDSLFAEQMVQQRSISQKKGRHWIKQELKLKGIHQEEIQAALEQVDEETEYQAALQLAEKKLRSEGKEEPLKVKRRIGAYLQRRGYSSGIVNRVLQKLPLKGTEELWLEDVETMDID